MSDAHREFSRSSLHHVFLPFSRSGSSAGDSHKNEGFLKSMWHKFTDNPEHNSEDSTKTNDDSKGSGKSSSTKDGGKEDSAKDENPKKDQT
jgi:molecular chaperone DnaJ